MVKENMENGHQGGRKGGLTREGMKSITVRLPNGVMRNISGKDLFPD